MMAGPDPVAGRTIMVLIETRIELNLPISEAFDAERNISLHASTQEHREERAVGGVTHALIELGEEVEWEAVHFGIRQRLRVRITEMRKPFYFKDEMISGAFKALSHEHHFSELGGSRTLKKDVLRFTAPFGILGWIAERLFLEAYMRKFLEEKNRELKRLVEAERKRS